MRGGIQREALGMSVSFRWELVCYDCWDPALRLE